MRERDAPSAVGDHDSRIGVPSGFFQGLPERRAVERDGAACPGNFGLREDRDARRLRKGRSGIGKRGVGLLQCDRGWWKNCRPGIGREPRRLPRSPTGLLPPRVCAWSSVTCLRRRMCRITRATAPATGEPVSHQVDESRQLTYPNFGPPGEPDSRFRSAFELNGSTRPATDLPLACGPRRLLMHVSPDVLASRNARLPEDHDPQETAEWLDAMEAVLQVRRAGARPVPPRIARRRSPGPAHAAHRRGSPRPTSTRSPPRSSRPSPATANSNGGSRASSAGTRWRWC